MPTKTKKERAKIKAEETREKQSARREKQSARILKGAESKAKTGFNIGGKPVSRQEFERHVAYELERISADVEGRPSAVAEDIAERKQILEEGEQKAGELIEPEKVKLSPLETSKQKAEEIAIQNIPLLGAGGAALSQAMELRGQGEISFTEWSGAFAESVVLGRLLNVVGLGGLINTPKSSAKALTTQIPDIEKDVRNVVMRSKNPIDVFSGLDRVEDQLAQLETQIQKKVIMSAELRADPEDIVKIESDIYTLRNLIYYYRREILTDPNSLIKLQESMAFEIE